MLGTLLGTLLGTGQNSCGRVSRPAPKPLLWLKTPSFEWELCWKICWGPCWEACLGTLFEPCLEPCLGTLLGNSVWNSVKNFPSKKNLFLARPALPLGLSEPFQFENLIENCVGNPIPEIQYFGNPLRAFPTLFQTCWQPVANPVGKPCWEPCWEACCWEPC